ncbi:hypothetical protein ACIBK8_22370 [Streptomyces sp. NPDC050161]|uniref:hypothetical protein n=1 Tax=Streptomyces sp. NPDC050161 TaxID=3365604 RepID=UPI0037907771
MDEYATDVAIRSAISRVTQSGSNADPSHQSATRAIADIDQSLRELFQQEAFPRVPIEKWWIRNVPAYAARAFCQEFNEIYHVSIAAKSRFDTDLDAMSRLMSGGMKPTEAYLTAKRDNWYVTAEPGLLFRACASFGALDRPKRRMLWSWATGKLPDSELLAEFGDG